MSSTPTVLEGLTKLTVGAFPVYACGKIGKPGIIVLQEWWGVNEEIQRHALHLSAFSSGYRCYIPDLYKGKLGIDKEEAGHLMTNLDFPLAVQEIGETVAALKKEGSPKVAAIGFCMGGALSLAAATKYSSELAGVMPFYGVPNADYFNTETIQCPVQGHFGEKDALEGFSDPPTAQLLKKRLEKAGCPHEVFMYEGAAHAFMNGHTPDMIERKEAMFGQKHNQAAVDLAWSRVKSFLQKYAE
eukprot:Platyproteum_vivax@DN3030_c0_g1_i1.p1